MVHGDMLSICKTKQLYTVSMNYFFVKTKLFIIVVVCVLGGSDGIIQTKPVS